MATLEQRLAAGLEAQDWRETASRGPWRRFGKFGRGAMYVWHEGTPTWALSPQECSRLWFSELHEMEPQDPVVGPILQQVLQAGDKQLAQERPDTEALLIELLYQPNGGSSGKT